MNRIFVARAVPQPGIEAMARMAEVIVSPHDRDLTREELVREADGCTVLVSTPANRIDAPLLDDRPEIRLVANYSVGVDHVDLDAARDRGVMVTNTPGVLTATTANMALALILAVTRRLVEGDRLVRSGGFKGVAPLFMLGSDLEGKTLGIFGLGRIGRALAERTKVLGMEIIYHNRSPLPEVEEEVSAHYVPFDELLSRADVLSVNAPLTDQTRGIFNYEAFRRMKPGAFFVNTGRGPIHVEEDLVRALKEGVIAGAGLDVYEHEPEVHPELVTMENVVLAPHLGSATLEVRTKMSLQVAGNVVAFLEGGEPPDRIA